MLLAATVRRDTQRRMQQQRELARAPSTRAQYEARRRREAAAAAAQKCYESSSEDDSEDDEDSEEEEAAATTAEADGLGDDASSCAVARRPSLDVFAPPDVASGAAVTVSPSNNTRVHIPLLPIGDPPRPGVAPTR